MNTGGFFIAVFEKTFDKETDRIFEEDDPALPPRTKIIDDLELFAKSLFREESKENSELIS